MAGFIGCGTVYFQRKLNATEYAPIKEMGNGTKFEITESTETKTRLSRGCSNYGASVNTVNLKQPAKIAIEIDDMTSTAFELAFLGNVTKTTVPALAVTGELLSNNGNNTMSGLYRVANSKVTDIVVTSNDGTTTYAEGTDYIITSAGAGILTIVDSGAIESAGEIALVSYNVPSYTVQKVEGGVNSTVEGRILFAGSNRADSGASVQVDIYEATITPTSSVDFLGEDFQNVAIEGILNVPQGATSAYEIYTDAQDV